MASRAQHTAFDAAHPVVPAVYSAITLGLVMFSLQPALIAIALVGGLAYGCCARGWRACLQSLRWQLPLIALIAVVNPIFVAAGSTELFRVGTHAVYLESFCYGLAMGGLFVASVLWFEAAAALLPSEAVMSLFGNAAPTIALMISMCMRLIPRFVRQGKQIAAVQDVVLAGAGAGGAAGAGAGTPVGPRAGAAAGSGVEGAKASADAWSPSGAEGAASGAEGGAGTQAGTSGDVGAAARFGGAADDARASLAHGAVDGERLGVGGGADAAAGAGGVAATARTAAGTARPARRARAASVRARLRQSTVLMGWAMEDSLQTADAMRARGWGAARRTTYSRYRFTSADAGAVAALVAAWALCAALAYTATSQYVFYPAMSRLVAWWGYVPYAAWMLLPTALHLWEELRFR